MDNRYNYEDSFLTKEEKRNRAYNEVMEKYNKNQKRALMIVFPILGAIYFILGIILFFVDEETKIPGIVFACLGVFFLLLCLVLKNAFKNKQYTSEEIENKLMKNNYTSYLVQEVRIKLLEDEVKELKNKIEELERKIK